MEYSIWTGTEIALDFPAVILRYDIWHTMIRTNWVSPEVGRQ